MFLMTMEYPGQLAEQDAKDHFTEEFVRLEVALQLPW